MTNPDPLTDNRRTAAELRMVLDEIETYSKKVGNPRAPDRETGELVLVLGSEARWRKAFNTAYEEIKNVGFRSSEGDRRQYAEQKSFDEWAEYNADKTALTIAKERAHSLRQCLSSLQTAARVESDLAR